MKSRSLRRTTLTVAVVLVAMLLLGIVISACGSDPYTGTWTASFEGQSMDLKIEKSGDKYTITDPTGESKDKLEGTEQDGKLVIKDPSGGAQVMTLEPKDDTLVMALGGVSITFKKK
jgi:hypothetical protein